MLALVVLLDLSSACAGTSATPATATTAPQQEQSTASIELRLYMSYYVPKLFTALGKAYERDHPGMKVKFIQASDMTGQDLSNVIASGNPPDLVYVFSSYPRYWAEKGVLVDLQEFITGDPQFKLSDISDSALQLGRVTGKSGFYALPARIVTLGILYNKAMFAKAGLAEPAEGWTWDELIAGCAKIQAANVGVTCIEAGQPIIPASLGLPVLKSVLAEPSTRNPAGYPVSMDAFIKGSESALFAPDYPAACGNLSLGEAQSASELAIRAPIKGWYKLEDALKQADERINKCLAATR